MSPIVTKKMPKRVKENHLSGEEEEIFESSKLPAYSKKGFFENSDRKWWSRAKRGKLKPFPRWSLKAWVGGPSRESVEEERNSLESDKGSTLEESRSLIG